MRYLSILLAALFSISSAVAGQTPAGPKSAWPHPVPCRVKDSDNRDLFVMTLGDVQPSLADGIYDPVKDEVRLKDGASVPAYYRDKLKVKYFKPIDKSRFPMPPSGWCSWYYYYQEISEDEIMQNARWIADNLREFGANLVQIDDGWQGTGHGLGENRDWTIIDKRFSGGMAKLAAYIKSLGLTAGIWLAPHGQSSESVVKGTPGAFLLKPDGSSVVNTWEGTYLVDPSTSQGRDYMKGLFTTLAGWGYDYFKIDGQPIVIREYRNKKSEMKNPGDDPDDLYRRTLESIRSAIGPDRYLLGCWVIPLEGVGIMNGSRTGGDVLLGWPGFRTALRATMQYYYLHNIAWYADPDVMLLRAPLTIDQARAWATLQGLTGQALMTSDRLADLSAERVDIMKRVYPPADIRPLDLFTSERNKRIWDLKINHLGRSYDVVGAFNFDDGRSSPLYIGWKSLGLPENQPVHVFDFWNKEYLGAWENGISLDLPPASCRVLTLLPETGRIQLISTSRHITQGWVDLLEHAYDAAGNSYSGRSKLIKDDPYELRFVFPRGKNFTVQRATARTAAGRQLAARVQNHQGWSAVELTSPVSTEVRWQIQFAPADLYRFPVREPANLWAEPAGLDGINLRWTLRGQPAAGYQVYLNGALLGFAPTPVFAIRGLDPNGAYTVAVRTAWQDGRLSEKQAELKLTLKDLLPKEVALSELEPLRATPGWRQFEPGRTIAGKGLAIAGVSYSSGLGIPRGHEVEYQLQPIYETFSAVVGMDDADNPMASADFVILGDAKVLWRSGALKKVDGARPVKISVAGVRSLVLRVEGGPTGSGGDQADWAAAKLSHEAAAEPARQ